MLPGSPGWNVCELRSILKQPKWIKPKTLPSGICSEYLVLPCIPMASFHHHFCFAFLKPLSFTWHHLNPTKRRTRAGKEHICFSGKFPHAHTQAEARAKSCTQDQATNIQHNMGHITSMCCGHLLHHMEKPSQQILGYAVPRTMATNQGAGFLGS